MASVRQVGYSALGAVTTTVVLPSGAPLSSSRLVAYVSNRGNPASLSRAGWTVLTGLVATAASPNDQHKAAWCTAGIETSATLVFTTTLTGGPGELIVLELAGVGDLRQYLETRQTQNAQPCTLPLPSSCLSGSVVVGLFTMRPPDGVGQTGTPSSGWTETVEHSAASLLHPWMYVATQVLPSAGTYTPGVTSVYAWTGDFGAGYAGTAMEFPVSGAPDPSIGTDVHDPDGVFITGLTEAKKKQFRVELNGPGEFKFEINRYSAEATAINLARDNVVKFRVPQISPNAIFAGFLETGDFDLVSSDEKGGENLKFGGRGLLAYTERDVSWTTSYVLVTEPTDGYWRFAPVSAGGYSTGNEPGQIIRRIVAEMQHASRPQHCMSLMTVDFDYAIDSSANAWAYTAATDPVFQVAVGETLLETIGRLIATGAVEIQMDAAFGLHAYNHYGRTLTGGAFGAGVVRFVRGANIAERVNREWQGADIAPYELVAGDDGHYIRAALAGAGSMVQKVAFNQFSGTNNPTLQALGVADLTQRLARSEYAAFAIAARRLGGTETANVDGRYLPGPPGTSGDFWVGDTVTLHTGTSDVDYNSEAVRVTAITISEDDAGNLVVVPELGSPHGDAGGGSGGGVTYGGGIVSAPGSTGGSSSAAILASIHEAPPPVTARYRFSTTTTDADPGSGRLRLSNATQYLAVTVRADLADVAGADVTALLDSIDTASGAATVKGFLRLQKTNDVTAWLVATVSAIASPAGYRNITIANIAKSANSPFADGDSVTLTFVPSHANPMTTAADLIVGGTSGILARLAKGSDGQVLTVDPATHLLVWATPSGGSGAVATDTIWDAKGDLAGGTGADTAARLAVGSNGQVLTADSTQSTGLKWAAASGGTSDPVTDLFGAPDTTFEFGTSSLTGLTVIGAAAVEDANTTIAGHLYYRDATTTTAYHGRYLASPATPFTAITKITDAPVGYNYNEVGLLVGVANPATGAFVINAISSVGRLVSAIKYTNRTTFSATIATDVGYIEAPLWLGVVVNSTTSIDYYWSYSGYLWSKYLAASNPSLTVGSVGIAMKSENARSFSVAFDYLRIWNSAKTFPGN